MAEMLFECGVCHGIYQFSMPACPRCSASNQARKSFHPGFYSRPDVMAHFEFITHNEEYNANHILTYRAFVPLVVPCNCRDRHLSSACPARRCHCAACMKCDREESRALDIDLADNKILVVS